VTADPHLLFWTGALAVLAAVVASAASGVRAIRRGRLARHRRRMLTASALVAVFLAAYVAKVIVLGHEDRSEWSAADVLVLRIHEVGIAAMLGGGALAGLFAYRFRHSVAGRDVLPAPERKLAARASHRRAGWAALAGGILALATACLMLAGMYARAA